MALATSSMLFGCVVWGHCFGVHVMLHTAAGSSAGNVEVFYRAALCWAISTPASICDSAVYLLTTQLPLHGQVLKQMVCYFGNLECRKKFEEVSNFYTSTQSAGHDVTLHQMHHHPAR